MAREYLIMDLSLRYVDDYRIALAAMNESCFSWEKRGEDLWLGLSNSSRSTQEITKAMCVQSRQWNVHNSFLPTLDTVDYRMSECGI